MITLLAFDTSAAACSAALWAGGAMAAQDRRAMARGHAEALMPMIERVMAAAGCGYADLDGVAVTVGPGAFTGLRVGLAAARGIGLASGRPVVGVTTLHAVAYGARDFAAGRPVLALLDTRRDDLYAQLFAGDLTPAGDPAVVAPAAAVDMAEDSGAVIAGDGERLVGPLLRQRGLADRLGPATPGPDAADVAAIGASRLRAVLARGETVPPPRPLYLHAPAAQRPRGGGRLRP